MRAISRPGAAPDRALDDAERKLAQIDLSALTPARVPSMSSRSPGFHAACPRQGRTRQRFARAEEAGALGAHSALAAEVEQALAVLDTPVARLIARGEEPLSCWRKSRRWLASKTLSSSHACRNLVRERNTIVRPRKASGAVHACAHPSARRGPGTVPRDVLLAARSGREARRRIPSRAVAGRDRAAAQAAAGGRPRERDEAGVSRSRRAARAKVVVLARPVEERHAAVPPSWRWRVMVGFGGLRRTRREPSAPCSARSRACGCGQGAVPWPRPAPALE